MIKTKSSGQAKQIGKKIKIAFVVWTLKGLSGSENVVYDQVTRLDDNQFKKYVIGLTDGPVKEIYQAKGVTVKVISTSENSKLNIILKLNSFLKEEGIEIVNPHHFKTQFYTYFACLFNKVKFVHTEHSRWQMEGFTPFEKFMNKRFLKRANAVIAISKQIKEYYINCLSMDPRKVFLILNGIDLKAFDSGNETKLRNELELNENDIIIGIVATIRPEKNHKMLIAAFDKVSLKYNNIHLVLIGKDFSNGEIETSIKILDSSDRIHYLGLRNDIANLLKSIDIFCLPSIKEGMPLSILEAMAAGVAVIGSNTVGINEVVQDNINGVLFTNNDEGALIDAVEKLLENADLRKKLARKGREYVRQNYCLDEKIEEYQELFKDLAR